QRGRLRRVPVRGLEESGVQAGPVRVKERGRGDDALGVAGGDGQVLVDAAEHAELVVDDHLPGEGDPVAVLLDRELEQRLVEVAGRVLGRLRDAGQAPGTAED